MKKEKKIEIVPLVKIIPDENQPRKNFNALRLADLSGSVKKYGILNPLIVEQTKTGYLLVDGERRYRVAKDLKLKTVPVIVVESQSDTSRLIQQFHLQEQHEGWNSLEKAQAVINLSENLNLSVNKLAELLSLPHRTVEEYIAYSNLITQKQFTKLEIPLSFAIPIVYLRSFAKRTVMASLKEEFTYNDEKRLEETVIYRIRTGEIKKRGDIAKIRDIIRQDPKQAFKLADESKKTIDSIYLKSNAEVASLFRWSRANVGYLTSVLRKGKPLGIIHFYNEDMDAQKRVKELHRELGKFISKFEDKLQD